MPEPATSDDRATGRGRPSARVGMVGAGQLAQMTHQSAISLGVVLEVLAEKVDDPAVLAGAPYRLGEADSAEAVGSLASGCDVVTFDHEKVPATLVERLRAGGSRLEPGPVALACAQDKLIARRTFHAAGFPVPAFSDLEGDAAAKVATFGDRYGWPVVMKARTGGYDGRGVRVLDRDAAIALCETGGAADWIVEERVPIAMELALVAARSPSGQWAPYPLVETVQRDGICVELVMPARCDGPVNERAEQIARAIGEHLGVTGILAVELFLTAGGELMINEIAVRPHNSGHATIEACVTSQFENHLRAVLDWPLGPTAMVAPAAAMVNVLGPPDGSDPRDRLREALDVPGAHVHLYAKGSVPGRKLGHVTALAEDPGAALALARAAAEALTGAFHTN